MAPQSRLPIVLTLTAVLCLAPRSVVAVSDCTRIDGSGTYECAGIGCKIVLLKKTQAACATATEFIVRDLNEGEQMCCTATEAIVQKVEAGKILLCDSKKAEAYDRTITGKDGTNDPSNFPDYCCTANKCMYIRVNLFNDERGVCDASRSIIVKHLDRKAWGVACTNHDCYKALLNSGEKLVCKRFYLPEGLGK